MSNAFTEKLGKVAGEAVSRTLDAHAQAIGFLQTSQVTRYLAGSAAVQEEDRILMLRADLPWFDCALALLEGLPAGLQNYDDEIREEAFCHLRLYYRPESQKIAQASRSEDAFHFVWNWLIVQGNPLLNSFLTHWKEAIAATEPVAMASSVYENGAPYQELRFGLNRSRVPLVCRFSFNWIVQKEFISDKFWGKVEVLSQNDIRECFSLGQQKQFFTMLYTDLYTFDQQEKYWLGQNLKLDEFGEFEISDNWPQIRQALDENSLCCTLKLIPS